MATPGKLSSIFDPYPIGPVETSIKSAPLSPVSASNTFYAIYGTEGGEYMTAFDHFGGTIKDAKQFNTIPALLAYVGQASELGAIEIRRVTRLTTPGSTSRRILDHGEQAPAGAEIKFVVYNGWGPNKIDHRLACNLFDGNYGINVELAPLYSREMEAVDAIMGQTTHGLVVRRVALTTTDNKVTYKEEVVQ